MSAREADATDAQRRLIAVSEAIVAAYAAGNRAACLQLVEDAEAESAAYERRNYKVAFRAPVPSGGAVYYMDDGRNEPGFVELIPATPGMDEMFTKYWRASVDWRGENPVRPFG